MKWALIFISTILIFGCDSESESKKNKIDELMKLAFEADSIKDLNKSIYYYSQIIDLDSANQIAINNRGRAYIWNGELKRGFADLDKIVKLFPSAESYYKRAAANMYTNRHESAKSDLYKSIKLNPKFGKAYYSLSLIKLIQYDFDSTIIFCEIADKLSYDPLQSHKIRSVYFRNQRNFKAAIFELTKLIKLEPSHPANYNDRGLANNELKNFKYAIIDFDHAIELNPNLPYPYNNKSYALLKLNQPKKALLLVNISINLDDKNAFAFKNRGEIYFALNEKTKACEDLKLAQKLSKDEILTGEINELLNNNCRE